MVTRRNDGQALPLQIPQLLEGKTRMENDGSPVTDTNSGASEEAVSRSEDRTLAAPVRTLRDLDSADKRADWLERALAALPYIGGPLQVWFGQNRRRAYWARLEEVLEDLDQRVSRIQAAGAQMQLDEDWAELVEQVLPGAVRSRSEAKRRRYAILLANAATRGEEREEAGDMAHLLDVLRPIHLRTLDWLLRHPSRQVRHDPLAGPRGFLCHVVLPLQEAADTNLNVVTAMVALRREGLIEFKDDFNRESSALERRVRVEALGIQFYEWISEAPAHEQA